jgi:nucleoside-diphosphate-sugar epimerase
VRSYAFRSESAPTGCIVIDRLPSFHAETALVTGATGFIGSHLAERLVAAGARVRGLARDAAKGAWLAGRGVEIIQGDLTDAESLRRAARGCTIVFSVAGWTGQPHSAEVARRVSVEGVRGLIEAAIDAGARRVVHTSSIAAYGLFADGVINETWPLRAVDLYGAIKAQSEAAALSYATRIEVSVIRPALVYGPRGGTWTTRLFDAVRRGIPILVDGGHGTFHPCYIDNLIDGYVLAALHPEAVGEAFTLVDGVTTWREFVGYYARMMGRPARRASLAPLRLALRLAAAWSQISRQPLLVAPNAIDFLAGASRYSNAKAQRRLGWSPRVPLEEGMRRTEAWLRQSGRLA